MHCARCIHLFQYLANLTASDILVLGGATEKQAKRGCIEA
jgi:hypothetical protein